MRNHLSTRRVFLQRGLTLLAAAPTVPAFLDQTVMALANPLDTPLVQQPSGRDGKVLVVVQLAGGNDGLNTVVPIADSAYRAARPRIGLTPEQTLSVDSSTGLHPNLSHLHGYLGEGKLAIVQGVGYPRPDLSHFRSTDVWESGVAERVELTGWLGRALDSIYSADAAALHSISWGNDSPNAFRGQTVITPAVFDPDHFRFVPCFSRELPAADSPHAHADVRHGYVQQFLEAFAPDAASDIAYLCGNPNMVDACFEALKAAGLPVPQIRREKYVSSK